MNKIFTLLPTAALLGAVFSLAAHAATIEITVDGLVCAFCAQGIDKKLRALPATADVYVSLEKKLVALSLKENQDVADTLLRSTLTEAGYNVRAIRRSGESLDSLRAGKPQP